MRLSTITSLCALLVVLIAGCGRSEPHGITVAREDVALTTFYPLQYFASRIAGSTVRVECPLPPGADPASWQPSQSELARYQHAALVIVNGARFEGWTANASLPFSRTVDTSAGFAGEYIVFEGIKHSHGAQGEHSHEGTDGHTWLDPENARRQAQAALLAMVRRWPEHEKALRDNAAQLDADLAELDGRLRALSAGAPIHVLASHPAYNYLARRYAWVLANIDLPPDAPPTQAQLEALREKSRDARVVLFEVPPLDEVVRAVESLGCRAVVFSPAESPDPATLTDGRDYVKIMQENIERLGAAIVTPSAK